MEKLALKKALFEELKKTNEDIKDLENHGIDESLIVLPEYTRLKCLKSHKDFIQHLIDICVVRNKF